MRLKTISTILVTAALSVSSSIPANAGTTGWLEGRKALASAKKFAREKYVPTAIHCRDSRTVGLDVRKSEYKIDFSNRKAEYKYHWAIGTSYAPVKLKVEKQGYKLVSMDQFRRKSTGLRIRCGLWIKYE